MKYSFRVNALETVLHFSGVLESTLPHHCSSALGVNTAGEEAAAQ